MFTVALIVKNEARHLPAALASLGDVPELLVCDTGSSDATVEVAKQAGARVVHQEWRDDFAAARTFVERHASTHWIVRFDADERFIATGGHLSLREWLVPYLAEAEACGAGQVFIRRGYAPGNEHWFPRVHRRGLYEWHHPVHELLRPVGTGSWPPSIAAPGALFLHERVSRPRPYRRILQAAVAQRPASPYLLFHLGQACFEEQDLAGAETWLLEYLQGPPGYRFHRSEAWMLLGRCRALAGHALGAFEAYEESAREGPRAEPLWHAARLALDLGEWDRAQAYVMRGRSTPLPLERQPFGQEDHPYLLDQRLYQAEAWSALDGEIAARKGVR